MNKAEAKKVLGEAVRNLGRVRYARLLRHVERGTPICCGERYNAYFDSGAG